MGTIIVGLVKGRHEMPSDVQGYVYSEAVIDPTDVSGLQHQALKFFADNDVSSCSGVTIYVTGLTPALLAAINALHLLGVDLIMCKHWNRDDNTYFEQALL